MQKGVLKITLWHLIRMSTTSHWFVVDIALKPRRAIFSQNQDGSACGTCGSSVGLFKEDPQVISSCDSVT